MTSRLLRFLYAPRAARCGALLALLLTAARLEAAPACDDRFAITTVPTIFDGMTLDVILFSSTTVKLESESFAQWRPEEEETRGAALLLVHQKLANARVAICPLVQPGLPNNAESWADYQADVADRLGEGTVISDELDTTKSRGVRYLAWDTRESRFKRTSPEGELLAEEFHIVLVSGQRGLRIVLTAPSPDFEDALTDLRFWLSRLSVQKM